jgi:hypothetical protein
MQTKLIRMTASRAARSGVAAALLAFTCAGCADTRTAAAGYADGAALVQVPRDTPTIDAAVALVRPGGTILISPGVYRETVAVNKPRVTLRGLDRNRVIVEGQWRRDNGIVVTAPGVSVENLTVHGYDLNGVLVTGQTDSDGTGIGRGSDGYSSHDAANYPPLDGFRVRYVTAANNGLYGIYAFDAIHGAIEHTYTSGSADSGLYVGQCKPCDIAVRENIAERNAVGLEADNASGSLYVLSNRLVGNRVGLAIGSNYQEALIPQDSATIAGNLVAHNDESDTPEQADGAFGIGIGVDGGRDDVIVRNRVADNPTAGLILTSHEDLPPIGESATANVFQDNGLDAGYAASQRAPGSADCLKPDNLLRTVQPPVSTAGCWSGAGAAIDQPPAPPGITFHDVAPPPPQAALPPGTLATPATALPGIIDVSAIPVPGDDLLAPGSAVRP